MTIIYRYLDKNTEKLIYDSNDKYATITILFDKVFVDRFANPKLDYYAIVGYDFSDYGRPFIIPEEFIRYGFAPIGIYRSQFFDFDRRLYKCTWVNSYLNFVLSDIYPYIEKFKFKIVPFIKYIFSGGKYSNQIFENFISNDSRKTILPPRRKSDYSKRYDGFSYEEKLKEALRLDSLGFDINFVSNLLKIPVSNLLSNKQNNAL